MGGPRHVKLELDAFGHGLMEIGGIEVQSAVRRVTVDTNAGQPNAIFLEAANGHSLEAEFDGFVFDHQAGGDEIVRFLENVDVVALEAASMEMLNGLDGSIQSPLVAAVAVLQNWARDGNDDGT